MTTTDKATEIARLASELTMLNGFILSWGRKLAEIDRIRKPISEAFSKAWGRRESVEHRLHELEGKVKKCRTITGPRSPASTSPATNAKKEKSLLETISDMDAAQVDLLRKTLMAQFGSIPAAQPTPVLPGKEEL